MKKTLLTYAMTVLAAVGLTACSNDNEPGAFNPDNVPEAVVRAFNEQYPGATNVTWQDRGEHLLATFYWEEASTRQAGAQTNHMAWYAKSGQWDMTESDITYDQLPELVKAAFQASAYASGEWRIDDIDYLSRNGNEGIYVIEVENGQTEVDLYYTWGGVLIKEIADQPGNNDYQDYLPQQPQGNIQQWLDANYPDNGQGHRSIIEMDDDDGGIEVEFLYMGVRYEAFFTGAQQWVYTKTHYLRRDYDAQVPQAVKSTLEASTHWQGLNSLEEFEVYQLADGSKYYCFELENRYDDDIDIYIKEDGTEARPELGGNAGSSGVPVGTDIDSFLNERYAEVVILEKDYDDGYLEREIRHEGKVKEVRFNGQNEWVRTKWEVRISELPQAVTQAIETKGYRLDDDEADYVETPSESYYEIEVRGNGREMQLRITPDGNIISERYDD